MLNLFSSYGKEINCKQKNMMGRQSALTTFFMPKKLVFGKVKTFLFNKLFKKTDSILDLGCGAGRTTLALYKQGFENILGIDLSETAIKNAKKLAKQQNLDLTFMIANALSLPFEDNSFDGGNFFLLMVCFAFQKKKTV